MELERAIQRGKPGQVERPQALDWLDFKELGKTPGHAGGYFVRALGAKVALS